MSDVAAINELVKKHKELKQEISKIIVGQEAVIDQILLSIFSGGHALLIGVPGLAKTLMVNTIAKTLGLDFKRIQFTPDLMPSDILGSEVLDNNREFKFIKGPVFANIILADEINRTPPKTQAALLEAMQERTVTVAGHNYKLHLPYFVLATQNPIEQEGTYPLPEAQLDRFMFKLKLHYPSLENEINILDKYQNDFSLSKTKNVEPILRKIDLKEFKETIEQVYVKPEILKFIAEFVHQTRGTPSLFLDD